MNRRNKIIIVCGPTASGKTGWGVRIAKKINGEIISADSRQVYRGLDIGTGKDLGELKGIKYYMIDICEPEERFTLFNWLNDAREIINDILARGKTPIVVGGTGLYVQALTEGFELEHSEKRKAKSEKCDSKIKIYSREELDGMEVSALQSIAKKLKTYDLRLTTIDTNNPRRLIRFIERAQNGEYPTKQNPPYQFLQIAPDFPREELYQRIDKRVDERFEEGMLKEVEGLINRGVSAEWLIGLGLEYRIITSYLVKSEILNPKKLRPEAGHPLDERSYNLQPDEAFLKMKQELKYKIHDFARRQLTWFRRFPEIKWVNNYQKAGELAEKYMEHTTTDSIH